MGQVFDQFSDDARSAREGEESLDPFGAPNKRLRLFRRMVREAEAGLKNRLAKIERGESGWQGTAWALERIYPKRFSRPDIQLAQQILVSSLLMRTWPRRAARSNRPQAAQGLRRDVFDGACFASREKFVTDDFNFLDAAFLHKLSRGLGSAVALPPNAIWSIVSY